MSGRGAWPSTGRGGTLNAAGTGPGRYYTPATATGLAHPGTAGARAYLGGTVPALDETAVYYGVLGIQAILAGSQYVIPVDGVYGPTTAKAVKVFQQRTGLAVDGVVGPATARRLFLGTVAAAAAQQQVPAAIVGGIATLESGWDPGAVGVLDDADLGLAQINGNAHPDMSVEDRFTPGRALQWLARYLRNALDTFDGVVDDAIASYNLGAGGTRQWIAAGRPDAWVPPFDTSGRVRDVRGYIDKIKTGYPV